MDRVQEEDLQRITAHYVAALQAGHNPKLSDYLVSYPHYTNEIADFVAYYHTFEKDIQLETEETTALAPEFHIAIGSMLDSIEQEPRKAKLSRKRQLTEYRQRVAEEQAAYQLNEQPPDSV